MEALVIEALRTYLNERRADLGLKRPLTGAILLGPNKIESGKVTFIFFDRGGRPAVVAKVARSEEGEAALRAEGSILEFFRSLGCRAVTDHAPQPLALDRIGGRLVLIMAPLVGDPMVTSYHRPGHTSDPGRVGGDFDAAGGWLQRFHRETLSSADQLDSDTFVRWIGSVFERYRAEVGWSSEEDALFDAIGDRARKLRGSVFPLTGIHGDFWMGNVLMEGGRVRGVLDWERARFAQVPCSDIYKFPTSYGFYLDRASSRFDSEVPGHSERKDHVDRWSRYGSWRNLVGFGYTYFGHGWFPQLVRRYIADQLNSLGIPLAANGLFFPMFLAEQAMALDVSDFRKGYRSLLLAFAAERESTWLWTDGDLAPLPSGRGGSVVV
jgi:hypothetical protein